MAANRFLNIVVFSHAPVPQNKNKLLQESTKKRIIHIPLFAAAVNVHPISSVQNWVTHYFEEWDEITTDT